MDGVLATNRTCAARRPFVARATAPTLGGIDAVEVGEATLTLAGAQQAVAKHVVAWRHAEGRRRWHVDIRNVDA